MCRFLLQVFAEVSPVDNSSFLLSSLRAVQPFRSVSVLFLFLHTLALASFLCLSPLFFSPLSGTRALCIINNPWRWLTLSRWPTNQHVWKDKLWFVVKLKANNPHKDAHRTRDRPGVVLQGPATAAHVARPDNECTHSTHWTHSAASEEGIACWLCPTERSVCFSYFPIWIYVCINLIALAGNEVVKEWQIIFVN